jgi:hypothetical protein
MLPRAHRQIDLLLRHEVQERTQALRERLQGMYSKHAAAGRLQSGSTIRAAVRAMTELATDAVEILSGKVLQISRDPESFALFEVAIADLIEFFRDEMPTIIRMASGRMPCDPSPSIESAAYELFNEMQSKIETKVDIKSYDFDDANGAGGAETGAVAVKPSKRGRPPASFWDDMWASIAVALYTGDLVPKTQAELEQAMQTWIETRGFSAATSTVRARARRLWDLLEASK